MFNFMYFREKYAIVLLSIAIGILAVAPSAYFRYWDGGYQGIDFFGSDGEWFYLAQIQEIYDGHWSSGNSYLAESKNEPYVQQPLPAMIVAFLGKALGISARDVNILTKFLFPALLTLIVYLLFLNWTGRKGVSVLMTAFVMLVQASWIFLNPGAWLPFLLRGEFIGTDHNYISYARPINPQISSIFFFGYLLCAWKVLFSQLSEKSEKIYGIASAIILGLSFYVYFFAFSFLSVFNAALFFWFLYSKDWRQLKRVALISAGALIIATPYFVNVIGMAQSPFYAELSHRLGIVETRQFIFSRVWWGVTALFLLFYRGSRDVKVFVLVFLATAFLVTNQQLITGKTAPLPAHYHWYYIAPMGGAILIYLFFLYFEKAVSLRVSRTAMALVLFLFFYAGILYQQSSFSAQRNYFISQQRYAPMLSWLNGNIKEESAVFANEDLSMLIPASTFHNVYHSDYLVDSLIAEERLRHALYIYIFLDGVSKDSAQDWFYKNRNLVGAKIFSHYYNWKNGCYGCFPDSVLDGFIGEYRDFLKQDFVSELKKYPLDYVLWDKEKNPKWRLDRFFDKRVYDQDNLIVYEVL